MIIVFDLDDTLYQEITYVKSGFKVVVDEMARKYDLDSEVIYRDALLLLDRSGRGHIFDTLLKNYGHYTKREVQRLVTIYRLHSPNIQIGGVEMKVLKQCGTNSNLYLVTDGNKLVQAKKIESLGIGPLFKRIFITHRFGLDAAKPSLKCFEIIKNIEKTNWENMVYIGDNPHKDFVNLNKVNAITIRILKGDYANHKVDSTYDAKHKIYDLNELYDLLKTNL